MWELVITLLVGAVVGGVFLGGWLISGLRKPHHRPH